MPILCYFSVPLGGQSNINIDQNFLDSSLVLIVVHI
jgi:hypothetical protein